MKDGQRIFGIRAIIEAIDAEQAINKVYLQKGLQGDLFQQLEGMLRKQKISTSYVPIQKLDKLVHGNHQGAVASLSKIEFQDFESTIESILEREKSPLLLLLDQVTDVRNFGAIIRTAECTGVHAVIVPRSGSAPLNDIAIKTSAGAAFNIPIIKVDHLKDAIYYLQPSGVAIVAATEKADKSVYDIDFKNPTAVVMGSEEKGINPSTLKVVDEMMKLPIKGKIESLNVSVACGAILYEVLRQRIT
ncbi:23S rRNA (guanosine(2251)-2'-O)-methyltransferase RlmB [Croceivirga thetidis]|uniref:23S rRNA (Guanosine(2251)-2'-O)-methyltransferase RlmB n=1 Tax=Croceivirga thetidis TaxID=2721623 RepID=A0ABX1GWH4_9FLAO|nr:23S rRNA (guanosine(2251)-2'-O)-methyltransferase RlmB [Croceivirga thetidis]NKI33240.1 23S rRNA (guanosine(2251)-2'-O)-methyltransferase RlmB [Croceivirga thetidis]